LRIFLLSALLADSAQVEHARQARELAV
jgi:hypothetical protein